MNVNWSLFKILGTGMPQQTDLFYQPAAPCSEHSLGLRWEVILPKVRPGPAPRAVIAAPSSYVIMRIILSLEKGLRANTTFYLAVISGTAALTHWSEMEERCCFSGLKIIFGLLTACFLSLDMSAKGPLNTGHLDAELHTAIS